MIDPVKETKRYFTPLAEATSTELLSELKLRYNNAPNQFLEEAIHAFIFEFEAMQDSKHDDLFGNDEEGEHGRPF